MYGDVEVRPFDETSKRRDSASRRGTRWLSLRRQQACDRQAGGRGGASRGSCAVLHVVVEGVAEEVAAHARPRLGRRRASVAWTAPVSRSRAHRLAPPARVMPRPTAYRPLRFSTFRRWPDFLLSLPRRRLTYSSRMIYA